MWGGGYSMIEGILINIRNSVHLMEITKYNSCV